MKKISFILLILATITTAKTLPKNPNLIEGRLPNGLTYSIIHNAKPKQRAELRLLVKAGSLEEEEDQRGIAHFVEHMAFNGTEHFQKNDLISYLESTGVQFGSHLNASTGHEQTLYRLTVPLKEDNLKQSFTVFEDWAGGLQFNPEEFDKERGVILEEARSRDNVRRRLFNKSKPLYYGGSRFMVRDPIGDTEIIKNIDVARARAFYDKWYRPELMHFVAVGDFNVTEVEQLIAQHFSKLKNRSKKKQASRTIPDNNTTHVLSITDKEATANALRVSYFDLMEPARSDSDIHDGLIESMVYMLFNMRAAEQSLKVDPKALALRLSLYAISNKRAAYTFSANFKGHDELPALQELYTVIGKFAQFGFAAQNLSVVKAKMHSQNTMQYKRLGDRRSGSLANLLVRNALSGSICVDDHYRYELTKQRIYTITLAEVNAKFREIVAIKDRAVLFSNTTGNQITKPMVLETIAIAEKSIKAPTKEKELSKQLIKKPTTPAKIVSKEHDSDTNTTEYQLENNITITFKQTDFAKNRVMLRAFSFGGLSRIESDRLSEAKQAASFIDRSGPGTLTDIELSKVLAGTEVQLNISLSRLTEDISGSANSDDTATLFELLLLALKEPKIDARISANLKRVLSERIVQAKRSPSYIFQKELIGFYRQNHPRMRFETIEDIQNLNAQTMLDVYRDRFSDMNNFHFAIVGDITTEKVEVLILKYFGAMPLLLRNENFVDRKIDHLKGQQEFIRHGNNDDISKITLTYREPLPYTAENKFALNGMASILNVRLRNRIREEKSGVYGIRAGAHITRLPNNHSVVTIGFSCNPKRKTELLSEVFTVIDELKSKGVSEEELAVYRKKVITSYETSMKTNGYWMSKIIASHKYDTPLKAIHEVPRQLKAISGDAVKAIANRVFSDNRLHAELNPLRKKE